MSRGGRITEYDVWAHLHGKPVSELEKTILAVYPFAYRQTVFSDEPIQFHTGLYVGGVEIMVRTSLVMRSVMNDDHMEDCLLAHYGCGPVKGEQEFKDRQGKP